ncbi:hypothetical protein BUALT_Bualt06G0132000 [Buddleja alternifolia]|uniref:DNA-directed RNA polymerase III subunit RPC4 n=1 Tax=Buddleja alternifolia TaxID=168488 RepID=A0AAV6XLN6_9LAMI|nr:hypothetical protein BUALT_Bualt06G0132000 [Buddleja alternifolia]
MDPDPSSPSPRKVKFAPKAPPRRTPKPINTKMYSQDDDSDDDDKAQQSLSRKVAEHLARRGTKTAKKPSVQVAFSHGNTSTTIRTFGKQKERADDRSDAPKADESPLDDMESPVPETEELGENSMVLRDDLIVEKKKEYIEPWDYENSYYPTTLPWRMPNSGDPELLNEAEIAEPMEYDENTLHSASELGLLEQKDEPQMIFFQFPPNLPLSKRPVSVNKKEKADNSKVKGKEKVGSSTNPVSGHTSRTGCSLAELPEGHMGKMLVYKSGAVKLKLGDALFDVSPGSECISAQNVAAINTSGKHFCLIEDLNKRAIVMPDIDSLL